MATIELVRKVLMHPFGTWHEASDVYGEWATGGCRPDADSGEKRLLVSTADIRGGFVKGLCAECFPGGEG